MEKPGSELPKQPIAWMEREPVTISKLTQRLDVILKSSIGSPSAASSNSYRILEFQNEVKKARLQALIALHIR